MKIKWSKSNDPREPWIREISFCCPNSSKSFGMFDAKYSEVDGVHLVLCPVRERDEWDDDADDDDVDEEDSVYSIPIRFCGYCGMPISFSEYPEDPQAGRASGDASLPRTSGGDSRTPRTV